ncbi:TPA: hypothetical protein ACN7PX_001745, partial [Klebsiella pneumoniae]
LAVFIVLLPHIYSFPLSYHLLFVEKNSLLNISVSSCLAAIFKVSMSGARKKGRSIWQTLW